ncbi:sugar-binding transcriptional regulator [Thermoactinomyces mirandus]|uniref:Central glycolytic genes regulator n=1 Tax=Thermoactinomyces mirandus TaxID=2756294 RepID=A0A7W1XV99_9BACL|nr:sugar-binding domain-containing protein [Thermoactinomyces mirandus]MBA4603885.1 hypothetical protein [Thermoactinomyces mirandus]
MKKILHLQKQLLPDLLQVMRKRYEILRHIQLMQPVGRRSLTNALDTTERTLRTEVDFLRTQDLVAVDSRGMRLTENGFRLLTDLEPMMKEIFGINHLEAELRAALNLKNVVIVPGDADHSELVKKEIGRAAARFLREIAEPDQIVAVSGGSTMLAVAEMMKPTSALKQTTFIPARGGVGESVELEANYIASLMAKNTKGKYRLMHVPEQVSDEAYEMLLREPNIQEVMEYLKRARIVVHGIGDAKTMAVRRKSNASVIKKLDQEKAVGESFGYYINRNGEIVNRVQSLGLKLNDLAKAQKLVAVAGGASKAEAILAICSKVSQDTLITDEGAAKAILKIQSLHPE